jgi:hypothetical protein
MHLWPLSDGLVRRGRHLGLEVHVLTQRVNDWFETRIGRTIQSVATSKWVRADGAAPAICQRLDDAQR